MYGEGGLAGKAESGAVHMARELAYPEQNLAFPTYQRSSVSTGDGSCLGLRHPRR